MILAIYPQKTSMLVSAMQAISRLDGHEAMPAHARLLLLVIADHVSSRGYAFPSQARLAGLCGMKEDAIGGRVRELAAHGWLELGRIDASEAAWWRAHGPDGHGPTTRATRYTLTLDKGRSWTEASPPTGGEYPGGHHHPRGGTIHTGTGGSAPSAPSALPPITPSGLGGMDDLDLLFPSAAPIGEPAASSSPEATKGAMVGTSVGEASPRSSLSPRNDNASQGMVTTTPRSAARKNATEKNTQTRSGSGAEPRVSPRTGEDATEDEKRIHHALYFNGFGHLLTSPGSFDADDTFVWQLAAITHDAEKTLAGIKAAAEHRSGRGATKDQAAAWQRAEAGGPDDRRRLILGYARAQRRHPDPLDLFWERGWKGLPDRVGVALAAYEAPHVDGDMARAIRDGIFTPDDLGRRSMLVAWTDAPWLEVLAAMATEAKLTPAEARDVAALAASSLYVFTTRTKARKHLEAKIARALDPASRRTVAKTARTSSRTRLKTA